MFESFRGEPFLSAGCSSWRLLSTSSGWLVLLHASPGASAAAAGSLPCAIATDSSTATLALSAFSSAGVKASSFAGDAAGDCLGETAGEWPGERPGERAARMSEAQDSVRRGMPGNAPGLRYCLGLVFLDSLASLASRFFCSFSLLFASFASSFCFRLSSFSFSFCCLRFILGDNGGCVGPPTPRRMSMLRCCAAASTGFTSSSMPDVELPVLLVLSLLPFETLRSLLRSLLPSSGPLEGSFGAGPSG
mmetsp:Transcript_7420/g.31448  ORF Transcript_7420/g.31448 Transcript_7420/m.31448 type:complete len:248 (-) Transcript_7420:192-935(-)